MGGNPLNEYQENHKRKLSRHDKNLNLAKNKNHPYNVLEERVNNPIDMIGGDEQVEYKIKCL